MVILATYVSNSTFWVEGEHDSEYAVGRGLRLNQGNAGNFDVSVVTSVYSATENRTTVHVIPAYCQSSLVSVTRGAVSAASVGAHYHTRHGDAGPIAASSINATEVTRLKQFADLVGTEGDVLQTASNNVLLYSAPKLCLSLTAGEALSKYQVVYQDTLDSGKCKLAQQDLTQAEADAMGMVLASTIADDASGLILLDGLVDNQDWTWTPGAVLYLSDLPGEMTEIMPASPYIVRCARALTATKIRFHNPYFDTLAST